MSSHVYQNLANFPEYKDFRYRFDFVTVVMSISFLFFIPSFYCTSKMLIFYFKNHKKITTTSNGIHPIVFKSFLVMQFWNTVNTILNFCATRIPNTSVFTSFCVSLGPDTFFRFVLFGLYVTFNNAQFFTGLFCSIRVMIMYTLVNQNTLCQRLFWSWSAISYFISVLYSLPITFDSVLCTQLDWPFQDGAIIISSAFLSGNARMSNLLFGLSTFVIVVIVITTVMVIVKLRSKAMKEASHRSLRRAKAETTLTVTMILIIIPSLLAQGLLIANLNKSPYYSFILCVRPLMLDLRVHVVSIYFYLTHPLFKKKVGTSPSTLAVKSFGSATY
uniref:Serpentine Receptor, class T n=2 Tax=Caenorhabditis tropicalis TaxID=1561998 RepID=A0A1I7U9M6_9PELO